MCGIVSRAAYENVSNEMPYKQINMILIRSHSQRCAHIYPITAAMHRIMEIYRMINLFGLKSKWKRWRRGRGTDGDTNVSNVNFENINYKMYFVYGVISLWKITSKNFLVTTTRNINLPLFNKFHPKLYLFKVFNHFIHATEHAHTSHRAQRVQSRRRRCRHRHSHQ